jgi:hypothetical protein
MNTPLNPLSRGTSTPAGGVKGRAMIRMEYGLRLIVRIDTDIQRNEHTPKSPLERGFSASYSILS